MVEGRRRSRVILPVRMRRIHRCNQLIIIAIRCTSHLGFSLVVLATSKMGQFERREIRGLMEVS